MAALSSLLRSSKQQNKLARLRDKKVFSVRQGERVRYFEWKRGTPCLIGESVTLNREGMNYVR